MEQPLAWFACEYALDSSSVARTGDVALAVREGKLLFRQDTDRKSEQRSEGTDDRPHR
jgi:hypothetical protein